MGEKTYPGRAAGGKARAQKLDAARRSEIARTAALARAAIKNLPRATHGSADHPLRIGDVKIPCYVLEDGTRVLSQRGVLEGLGMAAGTGKAGADRLASFATGKLISPFINNDMMALIQCPIRFAYRQGKGIAFGYPATLLADICEALLAARRAGVLQKQQMHLAAQAEILVRGFARVGIIALVDEATGYQGERARDALAKILQAFVAQELQPWVKTFQPEYYRELFRLRGLPFPPQHASYKPQYFGYLTNDIVYKRLAPGVLAELKAQAAKDERRGKLHQRLTPALGHPKLREYLSSVVTVMRLSRDWGDFICKLDVLHPRYHDTISMDFMMEHSLSAES